MTREKWDNTCLQNRVRLAVVAKKLIQDDESDHMERLGLTEDDIEELRDKYNVQRRKEHLTIREEALRKIELKDDVQELKRVVRDLHGVSKTQSRDEKLKEYIRNVRDLVYDLQDEIDQLKDELKTTQEENLSYRNVVRQLRDETVRMRSEQEFIVLGLKDVGAQMSELQKRVEQLEIRSDVAQ